jgi:hypothetical protein
MSAPAAAAGFTTACIVVAMIATYESVSSQKLNKTQNV